MSKAKIVTVTLNPSLDETITINHLNLGYHNLCADTTHLDASGRGVNVSHAVSMLKVNTHALVLLGNDAMGHAYKGLIAAQGFDSTIIRHRGHTRSDTILFDQSDETETHIIDGGSGATDHSVEDVINKINSIVEPQDMVVLAGSLPKDLMPDTYAKITDVIQEIGAKVVVMTGPDYLDPTLKSKPDLVVLTRRETETYFNYPVRTFADMLTCGTKLLENGAQKVLIVVDTFDGAVYIDSDEKLMIHMDTDNTGTDSGVVDAMVAGYLAGLNRGDSRVDAIKLGAAAVVYSSNKVGNKFGSPEDLEPLIASIAVEEVENTVHM